MNLKEKILKAKDIKSEKVKVDEWGVTIEIKGMSGSQRAKLIANAIDKNGNVNLERIYPELLISALIDPETGKQIFATNDQSVLLGKSGEVIERLAQLAIKLSGLGPEAEKEAEKNS